MQLKELVLDGSDISKAIIDYATSNTVTDIVVGASTKNTFIRYMALACSFVFHDAWSSSSQASAISHDTLGTVTVPAQKVSEPRDVPTCLMKMAPDYCTVHVIHKAKAIQVKDLGKELRSCRSLPGCVILGMSTRLPRSNCSSSAPYMQFQQ
jgi:K+-sensing histidine kinase KdpD